jgi:hypothetical protein
MILFTQAQIRKLLVAHPNLIAVPQELEGDAGYVLDNTGKLIGRASRTSPPHYLTHGWFLAHPLRSFGWKPLANLEVGKLTKTKHKSKPWKYPRMIMVKK